MSEEFFTNDASPRPGRPRISEAGLTYYKSLLGNEAWVRDNPAQAAMLKGSVENALAFTGQSLEPPPDGRSIAQREFDRQHSVTYADDGKVVLPAVLVSVINREAGDKAPDATKVAEQLKSLGHDAEKAISEAQAVLDKAGSLVKATALSAGSVLQLRVFGQHLAKHAAQRPKS